MKYQLQSMISDSSIQGINWIRNVTFIDSFSLLVSSKPEHLLPLLFLLGIEYICSLFNSSLICHPMISIEKLLIRLNRHWRQPDSLSSLILNLSEFLLWLVLWKQLISFLKQFGHLFIILDVILRVPIVILIIVTPVKMSVKIILTYGSCMTVLRNSLSPGCSQLSKDIGFPCFS